MFGNCLLQAGLCEKGCSQAVVPDKHALAGGVWCAALLHMCSIFCFPTPTGKPLCGNCSTFVKAFISRVNI